MIMKPNSTKHLFSQIRHPHIVKDNKGNIICGYVGNFRNDLLNKNNMNKNEYKFT